MSRIEKRKKKRSRLLKKWKIILYSCLFMIIIGLVSYASIIFGGRLIVDDEQFFLDATTTVETRDGKVIGRLYHENRTLANLDDIPEHVRDAFIAIEDRRFYDHQGVDFRSVFRAVYKDILAMQKVEGASTITQQLVKNLFLSHEKTWLRKTKEVMASVYLERTLPKERILELYLNEIYFGHGVYGIATAANYYFSKDVEDLSIAEGALLAGLAKAPNGYSPINYPEKAINRRNTVLLAMKDIGVISEEQQNKAKKQKLDLKVNKWEPEPWWTDYSDFVMKEAAQEHHLSLEELKRGGYRLIVNVNPAVQKVAYEQFKQDSFFPGSTDDVQGAFTMMDHKTGDIVAVIGGRDFTFGDLNRATASRQPGSTFKPLAVYGPALMKEEKYHPYALIPDQKQAYDGYTAENYDDQYGGFVSIYDAIIYSKNAPAVWLLNEIGITDAKKYLKKLHLPVEDKGLAIALGGLSKGVTPAELMEAYTSFAQRGKVVKAQAIDQIKDRHHQKVFQANRKAEKVFHPQVAWNMTEMLEQTVKSGTASAGSFAKALAGKTGSTEHPQVEGKVKDAWFAGYTPTYAMALWMGYDQTDEEHYLTGGSAYPTRLVKSILTELDQQEPLADSFAKPAEVDALPEPIILPEIKNVQASYAFGSLSLFQGKITWQGSEDDRVIYRIYRKKEGIDERVGQVKGETEFVVENALLNEKEYYVVPYDPLTKTEGSSSNAVTLSWGA
ncbi:transglycosylase domain-containing protein [Virgibacillus chiguensis]|uniref:Penicillin-binding protein 2A n=1 Tax=Virgibacillus chiguensis TaxID=411959 RepID=A0A1M5PUR9_9BACI|nr:PBP1A family penicillin-binding protein [Virgibacillus chiguensis]SHH05422.1 penicillin-binding protein 2A [Virgibacillus chiguensis]